MNNTHRLRAATVLGRILLLLLLLALTDVALAIEGRAGGCGCYCGKMLPPPCSDSACKAACGYQEPGSGGGYAVPSYDYEAERRRQEAEAAERRRAEEERRKQEEAKRRAEFIRARDEAAKMLKGSSDTGGYQLKGASGTDSHGLKGAGTTGGEHLKSVERHSRTAAMLEKEASSEEARMGFDTPGKHAGTLVYPKISGKKPVTPSALAAKVPAAAQKDPEVLNALAWYEQLDKLKAETKQKITAVQQQQNNGTRDKAALSAHIQTLTNQLNDAEKQQAQTEQAVKKRVKNLGLDWNEAAAPAASGKLPGAKK